MEEILAEAEQQGIIIERYPLGENILGIYSKVSSIDNPFIVLNTFLPINGPETRVVAAHELGHHHTTVGVAIYKHCNYGKMIQINKIEYAAMRWAGRFLISDEKILNATKNGQPPDYELAQIFNVTEEFIRFRLELYENEEYGLKHGSLRQRLIIRETTRLLAGSFSTI